jgi:fumarylacetoacetate (FAA) hydrolase family protein
MQIALDPAATLPEDGTLGTLVARVWVPGGPGGDPPGPSVALLDGGEVVALGGGAPTMADLLEEDDPAAAARRLAERGSVLGPFSEILSTSAADVLSPRQPHFLAPIDLQAVKAAGVTFTESLLERVIEEETKGEASAAAVVRAKLAQEIGADIASVRPGSAAAQRLKEALRARGVWSQYLEVGIGPQAEIFTKAQPLSAVGTGAEIGLHPASIWNNPEPEIVLVVSSRGHIVGATLGNDVNLRDFEGKSALLLGRSKDNNGSCAVGPFIRLFDKSFTLDDVRRASVLLHVAGDDGFALSGSSSMEKISRDPAELVSETLDMHQYPDGFVLFCGTMYAPVEDRGEAGMGFSHRPGDRVTISSPKLGALVNRVSTSDRVPPWTFGARALMRNLVARRLL